MHWHMKKVYKKSEFYEELKRRLEENKRLYKQPSVFTTFDSHLARFVAAYLGVNPWRVLVPLSLLLSLFLRIILGRGYSELVLRVLGGP